jgi:hypothetical protein
MDLVEGLRHKYEAIGRHLDERRRRLWAATEARDLGHGGIAQVAQATGLNVRTIRRGLRELAGEPVPDTWVRRSGGGRKRLTEQDPLLDAALDALVEPVTRGDPMAPLRWTSKSCAKLAAELSTQGHVVSRMTVARRLHAGGYSLQGTVKTHEGTDHPDRDVQFRRINQRVRAFQRLGQPVISVDGKKKELIGEFAQRGREWRTQGDPVEVNAYDFETLAEGKAVPYGVYDVQANAGWVAVGCDHDTAAFAVTTIQHWWEQMGHARYPHATRLLICADGGGSNSIRCKLWKRELQRLADATGLVISICHFPPGTSKWNKIEHRLFSFISINWRGKPLTSYEVMVELISHTTTETGLTVQATLDREQYPTGIKVSAEELATINLVRDRFHGEWNYHIKPHNCPPS